MYEGVKQQKGVNMYFRYRESSLSMHSTPDNVIQCTSVILDGTSPLITKQKAILSSIMTPSKILTMYKVKEEPVNWLYLSVSFL